VATASKKSGGSPKSSEFPVPMDLENMAEVNYTAMNAASVLGRNWFEALNVMNTELMQFVGKRLQQDMVIPSGLAQCSTGEEIFELYSDFFRKAVNQYFEEANTLAHIGANFVGTATKIVEEEARQVHDIAAD